MIREGDTWLTAVRVRRLSEALKAVRSHPPPGVPLGRVQHLAWRRCGGPFDDVLRLLDVLVGAGLLERRGSLTHLTRAGRHVVTQDHQHEGRLLARALVDGGYFRNQSRKLLAVSELSVGGDLSCRRSLALRTAAQLIGVLRRWQEVTLDSHLRVPRALVESLLGTWSLQPARAWPTGETRQEVGDRAEAYSYRWELEATGDPSRISWVALDDDRLGYDITNSASSPRRHIEVKGSQRSEVHFFMSSNEWEVGHGLGDSYEIHFWGGVSLGRSRADEYRLLREAGYPWVFRNLGNCLDEGRLSARPSEYVFSSPESPELAGTASVGSTARRK